MVRTERSSNREFPQMHLMGHTCVNLAGDLLFVWGGTNEQVAYLASKNPDLWIYETLTGYWRKRICSGELPPHLSSCSSCLIGQKMYVFGGHSTLADNWTNSLFCLDLETFVWQDLGSSAKFEPSKPIKSDKNVCWSFAGKVYVFGGYGASQAEHYLQLLDRQRDFQLAPDSRWPRYGWNNQLVEFEPAQRKWRWPAYTGKCPSTRAAHSGALMGSRYFVFGGRDSKERLNDLYSLDMETFEWTQIATLSSQDGPATRQIGRHLLESDEAEADELDEDENVLEHEIVGEEIDEIDEWNPSPSSSAAQQAQFDVTTRIELEQEEEDDDDDDDDFEYPHPSYLLERLSLSSSSQLEEDILHCQQNLQQVNRPPPNAADSPSLANQEAGQQHEEQQVAGAASGGQPQQEQQNVIENLAAPREDSAGSAAAVTANTCPVGRSFCSFTPISDEQILLFGGVNSQDQNLDDCWLYSIRKQTWTQVELKHKRPRLWHSGSRTRRNEVVIIGGSCSDKIDEYCSEVLTISLEPKSLKRLAIDAASRSIRMQTILNQKGVPPTLVKLIRLRKQTIALSAASRRSN